jgi:hypothetical protein
MRNVSADDHHKTVLCTGEGAKLLFKVGSEDARDQKSSPLLPHCAYTTAFHPGQAMRTHKDDSRLQEIGLATIAAMSLRSPDNTTRMVGSGGVAITMQAMRMHRTVGTLQRQVVSCPD